MPLNKLSAIRHSFTVSANKSPYLKDRPTVITIPPHTTSKRGISMNHRQKLNPSTDPVKSKSSSQSKHEHWKSIISAWRDSGLSQSAFCRKNKLNRPRFTYWRAKILGKTNKGYQPSTTRPDTSAFVPVQTSNNQSNAGLRLNLPNGMILSGIDEHNIVLLKAIIHAL